MPLNNKKNDLLIYIHIYNGIVRMTFSSDKKKKPKQKYQKQANRSDYRNQNNGCGVEINKGFGNY